MLPSLFAVVFAGSSPPAIPVGDPKDCLRVLTGLSCAGPAGDVEFEGVIDASRVLVSVKALPPHSSGPYESVAACLLAHPAYFTTRFVGRGNPIEPGAFRYRVSSRVEVCDP